MKKLVLVLGLLVGIVVISQAQTTTAVRERQQNQTERIRQGHQSGELTRRETRRLAAEQKRIQQEKQIAKSDGVVTRRERKQLKREQRQANRHIYRQKHNAQSRK